MECLGLTIKKGVSGFNSTGHLRFDLRVSRMGARCWRPSISRCCLTSSFTGLGKCPKICGFVEKWAWHIFLEMTEIPFFVGWCWIGTFTNPCLLTRNSPWAKIPVPYHSTIIPALPPVGSGIDCKEIWLRQARMWGCISCNKPHKNNCTMIYNNVLLVKIEGPVWYTIYHQLPIVKGVQ